MLESNPNHLTARLRLISWPLVALVAVTALVGVLLLYSVGGQNWEPWAGQQMLRLLFGLTLMLIFALTPLRLWWRYAYLLYFISLMLLLLVELMGHIGMGAQRWLSLGGLMLQPSELMKITLALALARYFHTLPHEDIGRLFKLIPPLLMVGVPALLVLFQPNLGTATLLVVLGGTIFWLAGVRWWKFALLLVALVAAVPIVWQNLHDYQQQRVLTFLNPEADPLGSGYNITQAKIALGSGGLFGQGLGQGTQSQLDFVPEIHTDFIFVVLAEEFGLLGTWFLLALYGALLAYGLLIALSCRAQFARLLALALSTNMFLYLAVNLAMVTGLIPVVGIPLPFLSFGGSALITLLLSYGILLAIGAQREQRMTRTYGE